MFSLPAASPGVAGATLPGIPFKEKRYFRRNEGTTDYATIPSVTLVGDFVIEFDLLPADDTSVYKIMDGGTDGGNDRLDININAGSFDARPYCDIEVDGVVTTTIAAGTFHHVKLTRNSTHVDQNTKVIDYLMVRVGDTGGNFSGILANLEIYGTSESVENATNLGAELVTTTDGTGWATPRSASTLAFPQDRWVNTTATSTSTHGASWQLDGLTIGDTLLVDMTMDRGIGNSHIRMRADSLIGLHSSAVDVDFTYPNQGQATFLVPVTAETMYFGTISTGHAAGDFHAVRINSIKTVGTFNNLLRQYNLDDNSSILANSATVLGEELWNNSPTLLTTGWVDNGGGSYSCDGTEPALVHDNANIINDGESFLVTYTIDSVTSGSARVLVYGQNLVGVGNLRPTTGTYTEIINVTDGTSSGEASGSVRVQSFAFDGTISNISIRQADGYGKVINGNDEDWSERERAEDGVWLGVNKWDDDLVTYFVAQEQSEILGGGRYRIATTGNGTGIRITGDPFARMSGDSTYRLQYTLEEVNAGKLNYSDLFAMDPNTVGTHVDTFVPVADRDPYIKRGSNTPTDLIISGISLREVLNVA